ncbi:hypothetical protein CONPUDRAFT_50705 [Coniophora puteana RWD-64-598 SS2]|uniref:Uncharacterized protein n=1 Tax=Coniophora puteana (strain RWD-64-598) TaxID=741705 RepID=A0A5M3MX11_CONPW|nr:uncharacterized protein CONPUDRAFT_50705 [Coniophora puteana RWD-64-598 SS2]EIW83672.1 hypothetical protein CONPUDRAFT_50705 [Coniophora puteana RWD-64-598 SS2]
MGLERRWETTHPQRARIQSRISHRLFTKAADDVERLVSMRLLEMTRLKAGDLGYKLRTQISKALNTRASAIRHAIERYNRHGAELDPPVAPLEWEKIAEYSFLSEFDFLRQTDSQVHAKRWAKPAVRQAALLYFDYERAKEEIARCNVEIGRLLTKIRDDEVDYPRAVERLRTTDPPLAIELSKRWTILRRVNITLLARIHQTQSLPGYSGPRGPGVRIGREGNRDMDCFPDGEAMSSAGLSTLHGDGDTEMDGDERGQLGRFFEQMHVDD